MPAEASPFAVHEVLTRNTGLLMSRMGMVAARGFADRMAEIGLTPRGWAALSVLDTEGAITQQLLGTCIGMDPSSMVATIDELEAAGLVERRRNPTDRRAHALHITEKGRRALAQGGKHAREAEAELLAPLSSEERRQLQELLLRLAQGGGQASAATSSERVAAG